MAANLPSRSPAAAATATAAAATTTAAAGAENHLAHQCGHSFSNSAVHRLDRMHRISAPQIRILQSFNNHGCVQDPDTSPASIEQEVLHVPAQTFQLQIHVGPEVSVLPVRNV
jgi:hypothetical protein